MSRSSRSRRLLKAFAWFALVSAVLAAVAVVGLELALQTKPVRRALTDRVSAWIGESYGVGLEVGDVSLSLFGGSLEIRDLAAKAGDAAPFLTVEEVRLKWRPTAILKQPIRVTELVIERPLLDLRQPLPEMPAAENEDVTAELPLAIESVRVAEVEVIGAMPEGDEGVLRDWKVSGGSLEGSLERSSFVIGTLKAVLTAHLEPERMPDPLVAVSEVELELAAEATGRLGGEIELRKLAVTGEPLRLEASGRLGPAGSDVVASFEAVLDPGFWLGRPGSSPIELDGAIDLGEWSGAVRVRGSEISGDLLRGFVEEKLFDSLELGTTVASLEADFDLAEVDRIDGAVRLTAGRAGETLLEIDAEPRVSVPEMKPEAASFAVDATARLLPATPGRRTVVATASGRGTNELDEWTARFEFTSPDARRTGQTLARLWPRIVEPKSLEGVPPLGAVSATGSLSGDIANPILESRIDWTPHRGAFATATINGQLSGGELTIESEGRDLELGQFVESLSGRVEWSGRVSGSLERPRGGVHVAARDLASDSEPVFDFLDLRLSGDSSRLEWKVDGDSPSLGRLDGEGSVVPKKVIDRGEGQLTLAPAEGSALRRRFERIETTFDLVEGAVSVGARGIGSGEETARMDGRLPLGSLAALPGAEAIATFPLERSQGLLDIGWKIAEEDWSPEFPDSLRTRIAKLTAGSSGRVELDVECPACSRAHGEIVGFEATIDGQPISSNESLELVLADGLLRLGPWALAAEDLSFSLDGFAELDKAWRLGSDPRELVVDASAEISGELGSTWLERALPAEGPVKVVTPGAVSLQASGSWSGAEPSGEMTIGAEGLVLGFADFPELTIADAGAVARVSEGVLEVERAGFRLGEGVAAATARLPLDDLLDGAVGSVSLEGALPVLERLELPFEIRGGRLAVADGLLSTSAGDGSIRFALPLEVRAGREATVAWHTPLVDWSPLIAFVTGVEDPERLVLASRGEGVVDLDRPTEARLVATLSEATITVRGRSTALRGPAKLTVADGAVSLPSVSLVSGTEVFDFEAHANLAQDWKPGDPVAGAIARFDLAGRGTLDSGLLNPFLAGGRAEGPLGIDVQVEGSLSDYSGRALIAGPDASILYRSPYLTRLSRPELEISISDGRATLDRGAALLNEGELQLSGVLSEGGRSDIRIGFNDALFRLDYGLLATLDGNLRYRAEPDGKSLVAGTVTVDRGSLTRDVQLDLDLLTQLMAPIDLTTTEDDPLDLIALEVEVLTREGVRVKNNLGDLLVRWEPLEVTGSVARPIVEGSLEVDPGGLLYAYGQTVRLDRATIEYPGEEGVEPRLDFEATTSLEDPTIGRLEGDDPFRKATAKDDAAAPASGEITADLARYYGEQFAGRVGESVGVSVSLRPLLIFGEADPGARLTVSRDLSTNLAIAASVDLRQAEGQTYLLEVHELRGLPRLVAQAFTDDASSYGGALLQRQEFGGAQKDEDTDLPRISKIVVEPPEGVSRRGIKRALALEKGDRFDEQKRFVAEVELVDYLMRKGYPDARVSVRPVEEGSRGQKVRLELGVEPGPHVAFRFEGEKIPKPLRALIRSLYRTDFFEPESIEDVRVETVRALRSEGFLDPVVEISIEPADPEFPRGDRTVVVRTTGGVEISPDPPVFVGVPAADAQVLGVVFANAVKRVELAVGLPSADRRLLTALADLGYPQATIVSRYQTLDKRALTVEIEPGPRRRIATVEIEGVSEGEFPGIDGSDLRGLLAVAEGDPLRRNLLARSAIALERKLGALGYLDARVRTILTSPEPDEEFETIVTFAVEPGVQSRLSGVEFTGLGSTRPRWARGITGLEEGEPLARDDLSQARTKLWRTGLFSGVSAETIDAEPGYKRVVFDLAERSRYRLTYGVRWDSADGIGAVVDATDDNFRGRAWTLGLRALYSNDEKSLRWLTRVPRAFGGAGDLELFAAARDLSTTVFLGPVFGSVGVPIGRLEATLQYSHPVSDSSTARAYLRYSDEEQTFPFFSVRIRNPQLGLQYVFDSRGPEPLTERGIFASVDLSGSREFLGGDLKYVRMYSQFNLYRPAGRLLGRKLSWSQSLRLGLTETFDQQLINSRDVRFFAGGEYSVRGYETESLGPQDLAGPTGGGALFVLNQELRWRVLTDYVLVLFADAGNVWEERSELSTDMFFSAGLGLRAQTPVGLLRLDLARPLDRRIDIDPEYKLYFGIGTTF